jgi:predicted phage terminase large subunit-like protein
MKSLVASVCFPAWIWIDQPEHRFLCISHQFNLALDLSVKCKRVIDSEWYQKNWSKSFSLAGDQNTKTKFDNSRQGTREALSIDGGITGKGADTIIIDDPHDAKDANSIAELQSALEAYESIPSRLNDVETGAIVLIMQRVHERDLCEKLLKEGGWEHLCIRSEYELETRKTSIGWSDPRTKAGELLWPDRFPPKFIEEQKRNRPYVYAAQYQQRPAPKGGGLFKRDYFDVLDAVPAGLVKVRFWDLACTSPKAGSDPDYSVGLLLGKDKRTGFYYILDIVRKQGEPAEIEALIKTTASRDGYGVGIRIEQEKASAGKHLVDLYSRSILSGYNVKGIPPWADKISRAEPVSAQAAVKNIKLLRGDWNEDLLKELESFPFSAHKDQTDALSGSFHALNEPDSYEMAAENCSLFKLISNKLYITRGANLGTSTSLDKLRDFGFLSISTQGANSAIARVWVEQNNDYNSTPIKYVAEVWRKAVHPREAIEKFWSLHKKRPFEVVAVDEKVFELFLSDFESVEMDNIKEENPLPIMPIQLPTDKQSYHIAALASPIATHKVAFADYLQGNGAIWSQIVNLQSLEDDARDAIAGTLKLIEISS